MSENAKRCENYAPADYQGHWRDWHKGHGCDKDVTVSDQPPPKTIHCAACGEWSYTSPCSPECALPAAVRDRMRARSSADAKWTLASCRERAKGAWDAAKAAGSHPLPWPMPDDGRAATVDRARLLALVERMRPYLRHRCLKTCETNVPCSCGLAALLREIDGGDPREVRDAALAPAGPGDEWECVADDQAQGVDDQDGKILWRADGAWETHSWRDGDRVRVYRKRSAGGESK